MRRSDYDGGSTTAGHGPISAPYSAPSRSMSSAVHAIAQDRDDQQGIQRAVPARLSLERRVRLASSYLSCGPASCSDRADRRIQHAGNSEEL